MDYILRKIDSRDITYRELDYILGKTGRHRHACLCVKLLHLFTEFEMGAFHALTLVECMCARAMLLAGDLDLNASCGARSIARRLEQLCSDALATMARRHH